MRAALLLPLAGCACHLAFPHAGAPRAERGGGDVVSRIDLRVDGPGGRDARAETAVARDQRIGETVVRRDTLAFTDATTCGGAIYDGDFSVPKGWVYNEGGVTNVSGVAAYNNPALGGSVYNVGYPMQLPAGCRLEMTMDRAFVSGDLQIRLHEISCVTYDTCRAATVTEVCDIPVGSGVATCTIAQSASPRTFKTLRLYRNHGAGSTASAKHLTIAIH